MLKFKKSGYYKSKEHLENFKKAGIIGNLKIQENKKKRIKEYNKKPIICKQCNKIFTYEERFKTFCNSSCSATYNNSKRILSKETKEKIRNKLKGNIKETNLLSKKYISKICEGCKKEYKTRNKKQKYCSIKCVGFSNKNIKVREKISKSLKKAIKEGRYNGWATRTKFKPSYPEQYFINLFNNENINGWEREYKVGLYFIDFAFKNKMIALEIDGKQHWENQDRIERDKRKDIYLQKCEWKVFRIKWFNPVNENNKKKLYTKINEFKKIIMPL